MITARKTTGTLGDVEKLTKHFIGYEQYLKRSKREFEARLSENIKVSGSLDDFLLTKILGTGSFGKVALAKRKTTDKIYAIKMMEKINIIRTKQLMHTISEIRFLDAIKCPFIIHLEYFFKNNVYVFLVMPFVNGGEMFHHLRTMKKFEESICKFYTAQVVLALEYLHFLGLVYRDLKPENILIDNEGYLKITDLGFCKKINNQRTYTLCGKYLLISTEEIPGSAVILTTFFNYL